MANETATVYLTQQAKMTDDSSCDVSTEIEITDAMIEAGARVISFAVDAEFVVPDLLAENVFRQMWISLQTSQRT